MPTHPNHFMHIPVADKTTWRRERAGRHHEGVARLDRQGQSSGIIEGDAKC